MKEDYTFKSLSNCNSMKNLDPRLPKQFLGFNLPEYLKKIDLSDDKMVEQTFPMYLGHMVTIYAFLPDKRELLENIKLLHNFLFINLPFWLVNSFKEAFYLFVNNIYTGTVANSGIICEFLAKYIIDKFDIDDHNTISQSKRLIYIQKGIIIDQEIIDKFFEINSLRNDFLHLDLIEGHREEFKVKSLKVINNLIDVLNYYSEMFFINES